MKKMLLILGMCFFALGLRAQERTNMLEDQSVEPPKFKGEQVEKEKRERAKSPICHFIEKELAYPEIESDFPPEGVVVVEFTVNNDGNLSDFNVTNPVAYHLDQAVVSCLKKTNGMWIPGKVNGQFSPMEYRVFVKFDAPDNPTFEEMAVGFYMAAFKKYNKGCNIEKDMLLSANKRDRKSTRMFNSSLFYLAKASVYYPNNPTVAFLQANNYGKLGMDELMREKIRELTELDSSPLPEQWENDQFNMAVIVK